MRYIFLLLSAPLFVSCHKKNSEPSYAQLNGSWIGIGTGGRNSGFTPPDVFKQFNINVIDNNEITVGGHTLVKTAACIFKYDYSYAFHTNYLMLTYDNSSKSIALSERASNSYDEGWYNVSTALYKPNASVGQLVSQIAGTKSLSGMVYDTSLLPTPASDSMGAVTANITFSVVNDSTIGFDNDFLSLRDTLLHYKLTDYTAKIVVFETFHVSDYSISTITYNYQTNAIVFEQRLKNQ